MCLLRDGPGESKHSSGTSSQCRSRSFCVPSEDGFSMSECLLRFGVFFSRGLCFFGFAADICAAGAFRQKGLPPEGPDVLNIGTF